MSSPSYARRFVVPALVLAVLTGCGGLGSKTENGNVEVYYKDGATKEEADRMAAFILKMMPGVTDRRSFQLLKKGDGYQVRMPLQKQYQNDDRYLNALGLDGARYSAEVFNGAPVEVEACNERMTTLKTVPPRADLRRRLVDGKVEVFYADGLDRADVEKLAKFLQPVAAASPAPLVTFKYGRRDKVVELALVVNTALVNNPGVKESLDELRKAAAKDVFNGAPTELQLCDEYLAPLDTLK